MKRHLKYKGVSVNAFGLPVLFSDENEVNKTKIPKRKYSEYKHFVHNFPVSAPRDTVVLLDIASDKRSERDWLRYQLKGFNYSLIQKGVWVGQSPLPKEFIRYANSLGFLDKLKILKLAKSYI